MVHTGQVSLVSESNRHRGISKPKALVALGNIKNAKHGKPSFLEDAFEGIERLNIDKSLNQN